jgi:hypothetical protein
MAKVKSAGSSIKVSFGKKSEGKAKKAFNNTIEKKEITEDRVDNQEKVLYCSYKSNINEIRLHSKRSKKDNSFLSR